MARRNLLLVALVLVALAAVSHFSSKRDGKNTDPKIGKPIVDSALFDAADTILFEKGDQRTELQKDGGQWSVKDKAGYPADMEKLLRILEKVSSYTVSSLITKDADRLGDFTVLYNGEENATAGTSGSQLTLRQADKTLFTMVLGKNRKAVEGTNFGGTYIRIGDQKAVYLIQEELSFETDPQQWLRTTLFHIPKEQIQSIDFEVEKESFGLAREDEEKPFLLKDLKEEEKLESDPLSSAMYDLEGFSIKDVKAFSDPLYDGLHKVSSVFVTLFDKKEVAFEILYQSVKSGDEEVKEHFIKILSTARPFSPSIEELGGKWLFVVDEWKIKKWMKPRKEYLKSES